VDVEGTRRLTNYDIFAKAGGAMRAVRHSLRVDVTDGTLNLFFSKGLADNPAVAAIEIVLVTVAGAREAVEAKVAGGAEDVQVSLYPNPARENLTVKLPFPARLVSGTAVVTATGEGLIQVGHRVKGEYELEIPVGHLKTGLYLLRLRSEHGQQVVLALQAGVEDVGVVPGQGVAEAKLLRQRRLHERYVSQQVFFGQRVPDHPQPIPVVLHGGNGSR
jgi:hypothetical protein